MDKLLKLCQIFECSLDDLVTGDLAARAATVAVEDDDAAAGSVAPGSPSASARHAGIPQVPAGPPQDICGFEEHQQMLARKVPTGIMLIMVGAALLIFIGGLGEGATVAGVGAETVGMFFCFVALIGGLAFLIPAGMDHSAFVKAHPFVEDFYTEDDRIRARRQFTYGFLGGLAFIFLGVLGVLLTEDTPHEDTYGAAWLVLCAAAGVWLIIHFGMLWGRVNVDEYNKSVLDDLEVEDIVNAQLDEARREAMLAHKRTHRRTGAVCGAIMLVATIVALVMLFAPLGASGSWSWGDFNPEGTTAMWFWVAWPVGALLCGVVSLLMEAFDKKNA